MSAVVTEPFRPSLAGEQLELSQFESYFVADDRPEYPMGFFLTATLTGQLDRAAYQRATATAIARHPLLRARLTVATDGKEAWLVSDDVAPVITWIDSNWPTGSAEPRPIDLRQQTGLHTWIESTAERTRIAWQFHHACADGLGAADFIGDVLIAYAQEVGCGAGLKFRAVDASSLPLRLTHDKPEGELPPVWKIVRHLVKQIYNHFARAPIVLQPAADVSTSQQSPEVYPQRASFTLDEATTEALQKLAIELKASSNDLILALLLQTLAQWQQEHPGPGEWIRLLMPTNLRKRKHIALPTCNVLGYAFIDRRPQECLSAAALVAGIAEQTGLIKRYRLGRSFLDSVAVARSLKLLKRMVHLRRSEATAVLTNPGDLTRPFQAKFPRHEGKLQIGGLVLEELTGSPPIRPGTRLAVLATSQYGRLDLSWTTDPRHISAADRAELMRRFQENLTLLLAEPPADKSA